MTKTVTLTLAQAETALECVGANIVISQDALDHDELDFDFEDIKGLTFYLRRAELAERLKIAIANANKDN